MSAPTFTTHDGTEVTVRPDFGKGLYVIARPDGSTGTLSFDTCAEMAERYSLHLEIDPQVTGKVGRGTMSAYQVMRGLQAALELRAEGGEEIVADLSMQLLGLEGWLVWAEDEHGGERYFRVDRSEDLIPHHLEVRTDTTRRAELEYRRVRKLEKVR